MNGLSIYLLRHLGLVNYLGEDRHIGGLLLYLAEPEGIPAHTLWCWEFSHKDGLVNLATGHFDIQIEAGDGVLAALDHEWTSFVLRRIIVVYTNYLLTDVKHWFYSLS